MKFSILGFNQRQSIEFELSLKDLLILRWFVDYKSSGHMKKKIIDGEDFYWVDYRGVMDSIPILNLKTIDPIYRSLKDMAKLGILEHKTLKQGGVWSYYKLGEKYINLIDDSPKPIGENNEPFGENNESIGENNGTKNKSSNINLNNISSRVITRLNELANKNYKSTTAKTKSVINARLNEGFTEEDFYTVIENKVRSWNGTDMNQYLRPETLFGNKFESYLNEKQYSKKQDKKSDINDSTNIDNDFYPEISFESI